MVLRFGRLKQRKDFVRAAQDGRKAVTLSMVVQAVAMPSEPQHSDIDARVGFTVTKKVGNAVIRNRVKRRLRAVAADVLPKHAQSSTDYVLIGRKFCVQCPYDTLLKDLVHALGKLH